MMHDIKKTNTGSYRCGPDLFARKCEGGYELWRAMRHNASNPWGIGAVVQTESQAVRWLEHWGKEIYHDKKARNR